MLLLVRPLPVLAPRLPDGSPPSRETRRNHLRVWIPVPSYARSAMTDSERLGSEAGDMVHDARVRAKMRSVSGTSAAPPRPKETWWGKEAMDSAFMCQDAANPGRDAASWTRHADRRPSRTARSAYGVRGKMRSSCCSLPAHATVAVVASVTAASSPHGLPALCLRTEGRTKDGVVSRIT